MQYIALGNVFFFETQINQHFYRFIYHQVTQKQTLSHLCQSVAEERVHRFYLPAESHLRVQTRHL